MIYRHFIAPSRAYTPFSNEIIRHPRLGSDAHRILTWQLSLPADAGQLLSETAKRCRIGAVAFQRAKRELIEEGFLHERRLQGPGGLWFTQQIVSGEPLSAAEAGEIFGRMPVGRKGVTRVFPQAGPSDGVPAVGGPGGRRTGGYPSEEDPVEKISNHPAGAGGSWATAKQAPVPEPEPELHAVPDVHEPEVQAEPQPQAQPRAEPEPEAAPGLQQEAREFVRALPRLTPDLYGVPVAIRQELTGLVLRWLEAGHSVGDVRAHLLRGMPADGSVVRRPGGLVRYLLREVPPVRTARSRAADDHTAPDAPGASAAPPPPPAGELRECRGDHDYVTVFRPRGDEMLCERCLREGVTPAPTGVTMPVVFVPAPRSGHPDGQAPSQVPGRLTSLGWRERLSLLRPAGAV